ncbi:hypothetical protein LTR95_004844 [Oleoguttula sp. CCFEE 5521]
MYKWYRNAEVCLAYLSDVLYPNEENAPASNLDKDFAKLFRQSDWFTRGWTLQELVAPKVVVFLAADWKVIGYKGERIHRGPFRALEEIIATITHIPQLVLADASTLDYVNAETRLQWASERQTTREEDQWYCLYSLLDAPIGANYGEGVRRARKRLLADLEDSGSIQPGQAAAIARRLDSVQVPAEHHLTPDGLQSSRASEADKASRRTALVFENIPSVVKKQEFLVFMSEKGPTVPRDMQYRFDNGSFRGKADATFANKADAVAAVQKLNDTELKGRKLRVDYALSAAWQTGAERTPREVLRDQRLRPGTADEISTGPSPLSSSAELGALEQYTEPADTFGSRKIRDTLPRRPVSLEPQTREPTFSLRQHPVTGREQHPDQSSDKPRESSLHHQPWQLRRQPGVYPSAPGDRGWRWSQVLNTYYRLIGSDGMGIVTQDGQWHALSALVATRPAKQTPAIHTGSLSTETAPDTSKSDTSDRKSGYRNVSRIQPERTRNHDLLFLLEHKMYIERLSVDGNIFQYRAQGRGNKLQSKEA